MGKKGLAKLPIVVPNDKALEIFRLLAEVNRTIGGMKSEFSHSIVKDAMVSMFSLNESVQSTRIEGTQVTFTDMVEERGSKNPSWENIEVLNYQEALKQGASSIKTGYPISTRLIKELHRTLMENARGSNASGGEFRKIQNFIGPSNRIEDAVYIPIAANEIDEYMENLDFYMNGVPHSSFRKFNKTDGFVFDEECDPIIKAAVMHAQFESIHPFLDGNGRLGRILIALIAIKEDLVDVPVFFVSEELEKERARYYAMLNGVRGDNPDWYSWIKFFITACGRMADSLLSKLKAAEDLGFKGLKLCTLESEKNIWLYTFSDPYTTAARVAENLSMSPATARKGLSALSDAGLLYADESTIRNRKYRNYDLMRILD
ncbi:Fic family protein [Trichococcus patagoniensis]|uniref:Fic family protein n=1 Tax=Trichococcus patagoniensis TaxID=382641 RepID=A0A2T5IHM4_9LACT|nr:Fic family protein [Trichococcus patagoniensis]PTQ83312.1 Fic family protein [Trichococcus patagoniensis]